MRGSSSSSNFTRPNARRAEGGKAEYRAHFTGRRKKEDEWAAEKHMGAELMEERKPSGKSKRGRRRS